MELICVDREGWIFVDCCSEAAEVCFVGVRSGRGVRGLWIVAGSGEETKWLLHCLPRLLALTRISRERVLQFAQMQIQPPPLERHRVNPNPRLKF